MSLPPSLRSALSVALGLALLSACGAGRKVYDLPITVASTEPVQSTLDVKTQRVLVENLPKIMRGLDKMNATLEAIRVAPIEDAPVTAPPVGVEEPPSALPPDIPAPPPSSAPSAAPEPPAAVPVESKGQSELKKLLNQIQSAPYIAAHVEKTERNLETNKVTINNLKMFSKQPNLVKIDVIQSTSGAGGTKVLYNSGVGDEVKVRPGGTLSFLTTTLPKTDDRIVSNNSYMLDDNDLFGVPKRLSQGYQAKLIGKTQINGTAINVLRVTTEGTNTLDDRISHEHIGYEPDTYKIRLWEMYDAEGQKEPYFRMLIKTFDYAASLPESTFKL